MNRFPVFLLLGCLSASLFGCGGLTQEDMKRHAIRRSNNDEDDAPAARPQSNNSINASKPAEKNPTQPPPPATNATANVPQPKSNIPERESFQQPQLPQLPRVSPPAEPLELAERRQRTIDNMTAIGVALNKRIEEHRSIPPAAILSSSGRPLLSWRVELLPYLGYEELHRQFRLDEPWDSPHNQLLLPFMPKEYQSPERFDQKTSYLAPIGTFTAFSGTRGLGVRKVEDGLENTVIVVEVNDDTAVPWTKPLDFEFNLYRLNANVGGLRQDGFFVIWGTGEVTRIRPDATDAELRAVFTVDAGEPISSFAVRADATAEPDLEEMEEETKASETGTAAATVVDRSDDDDASQSIEVGEVEPARWPVPDELAMNESKQLFRDIYQKEYNAAKTSIAKEKFARKLLNEANRMKEDYAGRYVLLEIIIKIAAQVGDAQTALDAADQLTKDYEVDALTLKMPAVETLIKSDELGKGADEILKTATSLIDLAIERDEYESAEILCGIAIAAARKTNDRREARQMEKRKYQVRHAKKAYAAVRRVIESLGDEEDPVASLEVGRYYCLVKSDWEKGLPLLAKCNDKMLRDLAEQELRSPTIPADKLRLADGWWTLAEEKELHQKALQLRAAYWYLQAFEELPHGLHRVKAELRVRQAEDKYGKQEVADLLAAKT